MYGPHKGAFTSRNNLAEAARVWPSQLHSLRHGRIRLH